jgi:bifunctional isochorismate lyase / aryl carrier protein
MWNDQIVPKHTVRPRHIPHYALPDARILQLNKVHWQFDPRTAVLLIHDMQNYWIEPFEQPSTFINNIRFLRQLCRQHDMPVIYTAVKVAQNNAERGLAYEMFGPGIGRTPDAKPEDHKIVTALSPSEQDHVVIKAKYSAFFQTDLDSMLQRWQRRQIILCGVFAHHGCMVTAIDAYMRNYQVFFVADALGDYSPESHFMALDYVAALCGRLSLVADFDSVK